MKNEEVKVVRDYYAERFREIWPIFKACIGSDESAPWEELSIKANSLASPKWLCLEKFENLTWRQQADLVIADFLIHLSGTIGHANQIMRKSAGENVIVTGVKDEL